MTPPAIPNQPQEDPRVSGLLAAGVLFGSVFYSPGLLLADWMGRAGRLHNVVIYTAMVIVLLAGLAAVLSRGRPYPDTLTAVSMGWFFASTGMDLIAQMADSAFFAGTAVAVLGVLLGLASYRLLRLTFRRGLLTVIVVVLAGSPVIQLVTNAMQILDRDKVAVMRSATREPSVSGPQSDVWLLILDGFPSEWAFDVHYDEGGAWLAESLRDEGFAVNENALAPYSVTSMSVPSLLDVSYAVEEEVVRRNDGQTMFSLLSGDNRFVRSLSAVGYEVTLVENGWHMLACGRAVDRCVPAPVPDESLSIVLARSFLGGMMGVDRQSAFRRGAEANLNWLEVHAAELHSNDQLDAVIVHLLVPHPPMYLSRDCSRYPDQRGQGLAVWHPNIPGSRGDRRELFADQVHCVSTLIQSFVESSPPETVVGVLGDHGPDSFAQSTVSVEAWTDEMVGERMLTLAAVSLPDGCGTELTTTLGVTAGVLNCLSGVSARPPDPRAFLVRDSDAVGEPIRELDQSEIARLRQLAPNDR